MKSLKSFPGRQTRSTYAWLPPVLKEKALGTPILLEHGEDFSCSAEVMRGQVYASAQSVGLKAHCRIQGDDLAVVCEVAASD